MSGIAYRDIEHYPEGVEFEFFYGGRKHRWTRYRSDGTGNNYGRANTAFAGQYGRAWLADACTAALEESVHAKRTWESDADKAERIARRKHREEMWLQNAEAKSLKARTRDW